MQITVDLSKEQVAALDMAAAERGLDRQTAVRRAIDHMAILDAVGVDAYKDIAAGLADYEAGNFVPKEKLEAYFRKHGAL